MRTISLLILVLAGTMVVERPVSAAPMVKFTESNYSFGQILQHMVMTKRFWLKSVADKPVKLTEAIQDCSCTTISVKDSLIKPGDSIPVDISLNSRNFIGFVNKRSHYLVEGSSDTTYLMLYAQVLVKPEEVKPLTISPLPVDVSQFSDKPRRKGTFTIVNNGKETYKIAVVDSSAKSFDVVMPSQIKPGEKLVGTVIVKKNKVTSSFDESFTIELTDDGRSRFAIPVSRLYQVGSTGAPVGKR
jgi:hypothetical protein